MRKSAIWGSVLGFLTITALVCRANAAEVKTPRPTPVASSPSLANLKRLLGPAPSGRVVAGEDEAPANDDCENFEPIAIGGTISGSTTAATTDSTAPDCVYGGFADTPGVWYRVVGNGNFLIASLCAGTNYDSVIHVYCDDCGELSCIAGDDDACGFASASQVGWCSDAGTAYLILVKGFFDGPNPETGDFRLSIFDGPFCNDPTCVIRGACCGDGTCFETDSEGLCTKIGGEYQGDNTTCDPGEFVRMITFNADAEIPDSGDVSSTINVSGSFIVGDLDVDLTIAHTWVGDLEVTLAHGATTVTLIDRPGVPIIDGLGCDADNYENIILNDEGTGGPIEFRCENDLSSPPNYTPQNPLAAFDGQDGGGDWTITVYDRAGSDIGTLETWSLHFNGPSTCPTGACCFSDGTCQETTATDCEEAGGSFAGFDTVCDPAEACCFPDGSCSQLAPACCTVAGGTPPALLDLDCPEDMVVRCISPDGLPVGELELQATVIGGCGEVTVNNNLPADFFPPSCNDRPTIVGFRAVDACGNQAACQTRVYVYGPMCCPGFVDGELTLLPADVDLRQETNGPTITKGNFDIWNQDEVRFSGTHRCVNCWDQELLSLYGSPNHFLRGLIHTDKGKARVDGLQSQVCPGSVESPMVGVFLKEISFLGRIADVLRSAITPVGTGSESAQIRWDIIAPQNALSQDAETPKRRSVEMPEPIGKGQSEVGDSGTVAGITPGGRGDITRKGSLLMWPRVEVRWNAAGELIEDTILDLSNDFTQAVDVQLYLVNGDPPLEAECLPNCADIPNCLDFEYCVERAHPGWNKSDVQLTLTANQPTYWSAATGQPAGVSPFDILDPGDRPGRPDLDPRNPGGRVIRGFVLGWAVSPEGHEICWNHLVGDALLIHYQDSSAAEYNAWAFQCVADVEPGAEPDGFPGQLNLDGVEYEYVPDALIFDFYAVGSSALSHPELRRRP